MSNTYLSLAYKDYEVNMRIDLCELREHLRKLEEKLKNQIKAESALEQRLFDIAYKAVRPEECQHVSEQTSLRTLQDYAILKGNFFIEKSKSK